MSILVNEDIELYRKYIKNHLKKSRYIHSIGVSYTAGNLAMKYDCDITKARIAGILHDIAKGIEYDELIKKCKKNNLTVSEIEIHNPELLHSKYGSIMAKELFDITDEDILNAIYYHTTGRINMSLLEKIIFVSDFIEPNRVNMKNLDEIRRLSFIDIDKAIVMICENSIEHLRKYDKPIEQTTIDTYNYYKSIISNNIP